MAKENRDLGCVVGVAGAPQTGKSSWMRAQVEDHQRVNVFGDLRGDYRAAGFTPVRGIRELVAKLKGNKGAGRYVYVGAVEDFNAWCYVVLRWIMYFPGTAIADELAGPTHPGKAPRYWGELLRQVAGVGGVVYGCTQRMSESDSTIWGVADLLHCHRLVKRRDAESMADELNCTAEDLLGLPDYAYIERESRSAQFRRGGP